MRAISRFDLDLTLSASVIGCFGSNLLSDKVENAVVVDKDSFIVSEEASFCESARVVSRVLEFAGICNSMGLQSLFCLDR